MKVIEFDKAIEFLNYLRLSNSHWLHDIAWDSNWIFRGQSDSAWNLAPSSFRNIKSSGYEYYYSLSKERNKKYLEKYRFDFKETKSKVYLNRIEELVYHEDAEINLLSDFIEYCDELGLNIAQTELLKHRGVIRTFFEYRDKSEELEFEFFPEEAIALAQHHGIPTRLLDFTRNSIVAAFFACHKIDTNELKGKIAVWAIREDLLYKYGIKDNKYERNQKYFIFSPKKSLNKYLQMQDGLFLYPFDAEPYYINNGKWTSLEDWIETIEKDCNETAIIKMTLPKIECGNLVRLLHAEKMTMAKLMPTHDKVTETLNEKWIWLNKST
jgi:hypothetical protein